MYPSIDRMTSICACKVRLKFHSYGTREPVTILSSPLSNKMEMSAHDLHHKDSHVTLERRHRKDIHSKDVILA